MAKRGPKGKATALKLLEGTRADRIAPGPAVEPADAPPEPPAHLDEAARAEWDRLAPRLVAAKLMTPADAGALAIYCGAFSQYLHARDELKAHGSVTETAAGGLKTSPYVAIAAQARNLMLRVLIEFGLTPASRARVNAGSAPPAGRDELGDFLAQQA